MSYQPLEIDPELYFNLECLEVELHKHHPKYRKTKKAQPWKAIINIDYKVDRIVTYIDELDDMGELDSFVENLSKHRKNLFNAHLYHYADNSFIDESDTRLYFQGYKKIDLLLKVVNTINLYRKRVDRVEIKQHVYDLQNKRKESILESFFEAWGADFIGEANESI